MTEKDDLEAAKQNVRLGRYHVTRQLIIIEELERDGKDSNAARDVLKLLRTTLASHIKHLARLKSKQDNLRKLPPDA